MRDGWAWPHGIANYTYSFVLAYRKDMFPDKPPTYADFFDTAKYPGKRTMWKYQMGAMEACLLGDGVKRDALYPADLDRAIAMMNQHGTLRDTVERARHYGAIARDSLGIFPDGPEKRALLDVIDFVIDREF